jgi:hypothetical protein
MNILTLEDCDYRHAHSSQRYSIFPINHCSTRTHQPWFHDCFQFDRRLARWLWRILILHQYRLRTLEEDLQATLASRQILSRQDGHFHQHLCCLVYDSASHHQLLPNVRYHHCQDDELWLRHVRWSGHHLDRLLPYQRETYVQRPGC